MTRGYVQRARRCPVSGDPGSLSRDIADQTMKDMRMDLAGYVINAVLVEVRSVQEVCEAHGISRG